MADVAPSQKQLESAAEACKSDILRQQDTMTMKAVRGMLEQHLQLPAGSLKAVKDQVASIIDELLVRNREPIESTSPAEASRDEAATDADDAEEADEAGDESPRKEKQQQRKRKKAGKEAAQRSKSKQKVAKEAPAGKASNKKLEALKAICAKAGIRPPPNVYKQADDAARIRALEQFMEGKGLSRRSTPAEIAAVKKSLEREKDLEGIDMSNIVGGGRRGRREAAAKPINYKAMVDSDSDADSEPQESDSQQADSDDGSASSGAPSAQDSDADAASQPSDGDEDGSDGAASPPAKPSPAKKAAKAAKSLAAKAASSGAAAADDDSDAADADADADADAEEAADAGKDPKTSPPAPKRRAVISDSDDE